MAESRNVKTEVKGNMLVITVDISDKIKKEAPPSSTGKTRVLGTTSGNLNIPESPGVMIGLNVMFKG